MLSSKRQGNGRLELTGASPQLVATLKASRQRVISEAVCSPVSVLQSDAGAPLLVPFLEVSKGRKEGIRRFTR